MTTTSSLASGFITMTTSLAPTTTTHHASITTTTHHATSTTGGGGGGGGNANSPLLFFVALGFGVVFTNLWIIVGVKYCFRYNSRQRQLRNMGDHGEPIDLGNVAGRPHRRRREKKLMSMEEVNERFPLIKYKLWRARREDEGLPAAGGVTAPPSRAASILNHEGAVEAITSEVPAAPVVSEAGPAEGPPGESRDFASKGSSADVKTELVPPVLNEKPRLSIESRPLDPAGPAIDSPLSPGDVEEDEDDPIRQAVPSELLAQPGDACAICIDTLDDEDEVRGLTCGHAFHAGCLDPWLTSRRACCPLCKHDYYIPKPRPEPDAAADVNPLQPRNPPEMPAPVWLSTFGATRFGRGPTSAYRARSAASRRGLGRPDVPRHSPARPQPAATPEVDEQEPRSRFRVSLPALSVPRILRRGHHSTDEDNSPSSVPATVSTDDSPTTPSQLEAGQRQH